MHDEFAAAGRGHRFDELPQKRLAVVIVDTDATLDRDRCARFRLHGADATGDGRRLRHQAGAELTALHAVTRATDVDIDLVVTEPVAVARGLGHQLRVAAAQLQRNGMLGVVVGQ